MKLNRLLAMIASALLMVGTMGVAAQSALAQSPSATGQQGSGSVNQPGSSTGVLKAQEEGDNDQPQAEESKGPESGSEEGGRMSDVNDKAPVGNPAITENTARATALAY